MANLPNLALAHQAITGPIPARRDGTHRLEKFERAIEFENVSFGYPGREPLFNNVSLSFKKGEVTAIVGTSGSGKTTIINLMLGLFQPTEGRITIDGIPLQDLKQETWLSKIGFVSQETFTYHSTISENILIGRTDRTDESIVKAAKIANAHGFISELDDGYQTVVGERGMKFSGGQQQRLAIARALLDTPEFMLLDEATSSLDTISERVVQESIDMISQGRTVVIIAHRLSTISHADKIIVLDNGQVVETGAHDELLRRNGHYARLAGARR
jgi:ABC-type multidrug transport system fused ATPase/permease subunit